jgi:hypothetical protein
VDLSELYRGPLEEFVSRRAELAKRLRGDDPERAAAVAKLRKPPAPVWAIDQLATDHRDLLDELLAAGTDAAEAQRAVSDGAGDGEALRAASARLREAVDAAATAALAELEHAAHAAGEDTARRIRTTLHAASGGTPDDRAAVWRGTLDRELQTVGFGGEEPAGEDVPEVAAAISPLRSAAVGERAGARRSPRAQTGQAAALHAARRAATERDRAAERARGVAATRREHAQLLADEAARAAEEATAAERAADVADQAATVAREALEALEHPSP